MGLQRYLAVAVIFQIPIQARCEGDAVISAQDNAVAAGFDFEDVAGGIFGDYFEDKLAGVFWQEPFQQALRSGKGVIGMADGNRY
jgi:hypothetical protein